MIKIVIAFTLSAIALNAVTIEQIDSKPPSRAKNFLIWQYLQQDITPKEADHVFYQIQNVDYKLFNTYSKKSDKKSIKYTSECLKLTSKELLSNKNDDCVWMGISPYKVYQLPYADKLKLKNKFKENDDLYWLNIATEKNISKNYSNYSPKEFLYFFNNAGTKNREENFNIKMSNSYIKKLVDAPGFELAVKKITTSYKFKTLQKSLLNIDGSKLSDQTNLFLALNALRYGKKSQALKYLDTSYLRAYSRMSKDRAKFWNYLITKNSDVLKALSISQDINIYSLYAKEKLHVEVNNYFIQLDLDEKSKKYNIQDPFTWDQILKKIRSTPKEKLNSLTKEYNNPALSSVQTYILERASGYKTHGFILPYKNAMKDFSNDQKALMLSLMRQESRFIPSALSTSYALGVMQLMPFLVEVLDKNEDTKIKELSDMFDPDRNIAYAYKHISWIQKSLYHPLFIAYAYNGGMGFTRRHLEQGTFTKGKYEPFFSMEMMANDESREYGKKVLANYVIYKKILGEKVSIIHLFEKLTKPYLNDKFRK